MQFMEMAAFFFGYSGLGVAIIEYELRYYLINGEYRDGDSAPVPAPPLGINVARERMLLMLLVITLLNTIFCTMTIFIRYWLTL